MAKSARWTGAMLALAFALGGCPGDSDDDASEEGGGHHDVDAGDDSSGQSGGAGHGAGAGGGGQNGGAGRTAGTGGAQGGAGQAGADSRGDGGVTTGGCATGGCSGELCTEASGDPIASPCIYREEFACYADAECARQADGECGWTPSEKLETCLNDAGNGERGELRWYETCGHPVCGLTPDPHDDPNVPNCTSEEAGDACDEADAHCDGVASCGAMLRCTDADPTMQAGGCPRSRARFKRDIDYVSEQERRAYHEQLVSLPLASWRYRDANTAAAPQLGFVIEDIEPSAAVSGDRVNMYGYLSMAVAAIQVQQDQIQALEHELRALRDQLASAHEAPLCAP
jgi:hypothetical protein